MSPGEPPERAVSDAPARRPALLLDVMGTLVYDPFYVEVPEFLGLTLEDLLEVKHPDAWVRFELGEIDEATMLASFFRDGRALPPGLREHMASSYRWLDGMEDLVRELCELGYALHALSNYTEWYRLIERRLGLSRYVEWSFVSCDTGLRKPDPEAYRSAARSLELAPAACLFVDDREENCRAAREVGMPSIHFVGAFELREELEERGLLS